MLDGEINLVDCRNNSPNKIFPATGVTLYVKIFVEEFFVYVLHTKIFYNEKTANNDILSINKIILILQTVFTVTICGYTVFSTSSPVGILI